MPSVNCSITNTETRGTPRLIGLSKGKCQREQTCEDVNTGEILKVTCYDAEYDIYHYEMTVTYSWTFQCGIGSCSYSCTIPTTHTVTWKENGICAGTHCCPKNSLPVVGPGEDGPPRPPGQWEIIWDPPIYIPPPCDPSIAGPPDPIS